MAITVLAVSLILMARTPRTPTRAGVARAGGVLEPEPASFAPSVLSDGALEATGLRNEGLLVSVLSDVRTGGGWLGESKYTIGQL